MAPTSDLSIECAVYILKMDNSLDRLVRSNDPSLQKMVEERIRAVLRAPASRFSYALSRSDFTQLAHLYGEPYVADPAADLDQFFDIVNGRLFSRSVPTQLAVLYLFGSGSHYRANIGALSAAGEAIVGFCMEQFGYTTLVRPLGIMPDIVLSTNRASMMHLALVEAKASTRTEPDRLIEKNVSQFLVDIKTRAQGFSYHYEGYLFGTHFCDGGQVFCSCLCVDLGWYAKSNRAGAGPTPGIRSTGSLQGTPAERLERLIRLQAETADAQDEYLTSLLSEEATRMAMLDLIFQRKLGDQQQPGEPRSQDQVDAYVFEVASELGLAEQWSKGQALIRDIKSKEKDHISRALIRYQKPTVELD